MDLVQSMKWVKREVGLSIIEKVAELIEISIPETSPMKVLI